MGKDEFAKDLTQSSFEPRLYYKYTVNLKNNQILKIILIFFDISSFCSTIHIEQIALHN